MNTLDCAWPGIVFAPICHGYVAWIYLYRHLRSCVGLWKALARMVSWNTRSWNVATDFGSRFAKKSTRDPKSVHNFDVSIWWSRRALRPLEIRVDFFSILWRTRISKKKMGVASIVFVYDSMPRFGSRCWLVSAENARMWTRDLWKWMPMAYTQCGSCGTVFGTQAPYNVVFLHVRRATLSLRTPTPQKSSRSIFWSRSREYQFIDSRDTRLP